MWQEMEIVVSHENGEVPVTVFHIKGEISAESSEQLEQQARSSFEAGTRNLVLDLTDVAFMSSGGLRAIHHIFTLLHTESPEDAKSMRKGILAGTYHSPHLKLVNPSRNVRQALQTAGYDMFLETYPVLQKAIASF
jgi:anti-anti-sigma factor